MESTNSMSQEMGHVTLSHGMSLVVTVTQDCAPPLSVICQCQFPLNSLLGYAPSFLGEFSHDTIVVALSLSFLNVLKSCCLVLFSWRKLQKTQKKTQCSEKSFMSLIFSVPETNSIVANKQSLVGRRLMYNS